MSILGVSTLHDSVVDAIRVGGQSYVEMDDLIEKSGQIVSSYIQSESALVVNSASAGIALSVAGLITKNNHYLIPKLHQVAPLLSNEVLILKGHHVDYGAPIETMVNLGGGQLKEVGYANGCSIQQLEAAIHKQTVAFLFVQSHHCVQKNMPSLVEVSEICQKKSIPLIVDAAAEEDFTSFSHLADLVIFSGSKALEGPTSGIIAGKNEYIQYIKYHLKGIGRAMKVGKESIFGLIQAIANYQTNRNNIDSQLAQLKQLEVLSQFDGIQVSIQSDEAGREIYRARIHIDPKKSRLSALQVVKKLREGEPAIYTRDYHANTGHFDIDPRPLLSGDMEMIVEKLQQILGGK
jgi:L-seryl-tRNA(Ser) seleniumtransferase